MANLSEVLKSEEHKAWLTPINTETGKPWGTEEKPFRIELHSIRSRKARDFAWKLECAKQSAREHGKDVLSAEAIGETFYDTFVGLTSAWENLETVEGSLVPCTPETVRNVYVGNIDIFLQVQRFVLDESNFPSLKVLETESKNLQSGSVGA